MSRSDAKPQRLAPPIRRCWGNDVYCQVARLLHSPLYMTNILDPGSFEPEQVRAILQGMARVASADGDDARELTLMSDFLEACRPDVRESLTLAAVRQTPLDLAQARQALSSVPLKQTFLAACLLVAYSDGQVSSAEQSAVSELIEGLEIDPDIVELTRARVDGLLVARVTKVSDLDLLRDLSAEL